ncbi:MAG: hypothetical protein AB7H70_14270 [Rhodospirillaceae bacterium]
MKHHAVIALGAVVLLAAGGAYLLTSIDRDAKKAVVMSNGQPSAGAAKSSPAASVVEADLLPEPIAEVEVPPPPPPPRPKKNPAIINPVLRYNIPDPPPAP